MDPNSRGPEEYGHDGADYDRADHEGPDHDGADRAGGEDDGARYAVALHDGAGRGTPPRTPRESHGADLVQHAPALARTVQIVAGDLLLTVNPVDGSEIEPCPPGERPARPPKYTAAERAAADRAARPPVPPGPPQPALPLLQRHDERENLVRHLARGRSVRLTGPAGSGRSTLLDIVTEDCADLAPDGVVRLSGHHRTSDELLHDLFHAVHPAPLHRPQRDELLSGVGEIGAVVVLDDLEFGGAGLDALLEATPECAFLMSATPDVPAPSDDSGVEEVVLSGLERAAGLDLLERVVGRSLTEDESNWAGDLWFESEGLPLRFVQAGALLRQRDRLRADSCKDEFGGVFGEARPDDMLVWPGSGDEILLPALGQAAAPAPLLASRLSTCAREALRYAVALGGEVPHPAHLPALVGDTHADAALGELKDCGLVSPVGSRYRLAAGVHAQLEAAGYADGVEGRARTVAQHYAWWAGHPSVTPERVCVEADAILAALGVLAPLTMAGDDEDSIAVRLARTSAPAFAAGLHWGAWERALRSGAEAARLAGDVAEQAYFHHELGVLALCGGHHDRARAELEASIGLRGALSDRRGTVAGRRALALVADRSGIASGFALAAGAAGAADGGQQDAASRGGTAAFPSLKPPARAVPGIVTHRAPRRPAAPGKTRGGAGNFARRNAVAGGAGALLVAVLATVVTLGATSGKDGEKPSDNVGVDPSVSQGLDDSSLADTPENAGDTGEATSRPTRPGPDGTPGTSDDPAPSVSSSGGSADAPSGTRGPSRTTSPSKSPTKRPTKSPSPTKSASPSPSTTKPTGTPTDSASPTASETSSSPSSSGSTGAPSSAGASTGPGEPDPSA